MGNYCIRNITKQQQLLYYRYGDTEVVCKLSTTSNIENKNNFKSK